MVVFATLLNARTGEVIFGEKKNESRWLYQYSTPTVVRGISTVAEAWS